ncbi:MAG: hypothetical protein DVB31_16750 [Verrucomicrobia bacterium]|nr:MAG: hypothetical protein DVB31_16750 [Verrucomicrobiota bacterium]
MKSLFKFAAVAALSLGVTAFAKDITVSGEAKCAKCALKIKGVDKCQNVVEVKKGDKTRLWYLKGEASEKFHKEICGDTKEVVVKGEVSDVDGKKWIAVTEIKAKGK